jgi:hypothetical protein
VPVTPAVDGGSTSGSASPGSLGSDSSDAGSPGAPTDDAGPASPGSSSGGALDGGAFDGASIDGGDGGGSEDAVAPDGGLDPSLAPGGNFDLSVWELEEPVGVAGAPTTVPPARLEGPNGYEDAYFFTDPTDGSMAFWDPESGVAIAGSRYPRSELREMAADGGAASWATSGTNSLRATLEATQIPDHVAVGEIQVATAVTGAPAPKPLLELFYYATGAIAIEQASAGGPDVIELVGYVPLGTRWSYVLDLSGDTLSVSIDGGAAQTFVVPKRLRLERMYFGAGDYDQSAGSSSMVGAKVQFYALQIVHGP